MTTPHDPAHSPKRRIAARHLVATLVMALVFTLLPAVPESSAQVPWIRGWTYVHDDGHAHFACKRAVNTEHYGALWEVRTLTIDRPGGHSRFQSWSRTITVSAIRNNVHYKYSNHNNWLGAMSGNRMYFSRYHRDRLWIQTNGYGPHNPRFQRSWDPAHFAWCR